MATKHPTHSTARKVGPIRTSMKANGGDGGGGIRTPDRGGDRAKQKHYPKSMTLYAASANPWQFVWWGGRKSCAKMVLLSISVVAITLVMSMMIASKGIWFRACKFGLDKTAYSSEIKPDRR